MEDLWQRLIENLSGRLEGPFRFRFILQPIIAFILAIIDGARDAKNGRHVYLWSILFNGKERRQLLKSGWKSTAKIFFVAVVFDAAYQLIVFRRIYAGETLIVAFFLAIVPYFLVRGPVNRLSKAVRKKT